MTITSASRRRLPDRRCSVTEEIKINGQTYLATAGFDPDDHELLEVFISGVKEGSSMESLLGDLAVVISVALQSGVTIESLAKSVARTRAAPVTPEELDNPSMINAAPATAIGATLDYLMSLQNQISQQTQKKTRTIRIQVLPKKP